MKHIKFILGILFVSSISFFIASITYAGSFALLSPLGGGTYKAGDTINIQWSQQDVVGLNLEYTQAGGSVNNIVSLDSSKLGTNNYAWVIPNYVIGEIKIKYIAGHKNADGTFGQIIGESNALKVMYNASIKVTKPLAGEKIEAGANYTISYSLTTAYPNDLVTFDFELYKGGKFYKKIDFATRDFTHPWQVPKEIPAGDDYQVKVQDESRGLVAFSDKFTIVSNYAPKVYSVNFTFPANGSALQFGKSYTASWTSECVGGWMSLWLAINSKYESNNEYILHPLSNINNSTSGFLFNQLAEPDVATRSFTVPSSMGYVLKEYYNGVWQTSDILWFTANNKGSVSMLSFGPSGSIIDLVDANNYRLYVNISGNDKNTGTSCRVEGFSNYFSISHSSVPQAPEAPASTPAQNYLISDIKPGWLVKNRKYAEVFYVDTEKKLRWIINEAAAVKNFGLAWNQNIKEFDDLSASGLSYGSQIGESDSLATNNNTSNSPVYSVSDIKPGWLVKNRKYAEVFFVSTDRKLRWIINEAAALKQFGPTWNQDIKEFDDLNASGLLFGDDLE